MNGSHSNQSHLETLNIPLILTYKISLLRLQAILNQCSPFCGNRDVMNISVILIFLFVPQLLSISDCIHWKLQNFQRASSCQSLRDSKYTFNMHYIIEFIF